MLKPHLKTIRAKQMITGQAVEYTKNTYKSIRSAINRHLLDLGRIDLDVVRGREFRTSNDILDGKLKKNLQEGVGRPTKHKDIISSNDLKQFPLTCMEE